MIKSNYIFAKIKQVILFIFNYECYACRCRKIDLHVHHINGNRFDNDAFNLIPLCNSCHILTHKTKMSFRPVLTEKTIVELKKLNSFMRNFSR